MTVIKELAQENVLPPDFLKIRVYLYKYTPTFNYLGKGKTNIAAIQKTLVGNQLQVTQTLTYGNILNELKDKKEGPTGVETLLRSINGYPIFYAGPIPLYVRNAYKLISPSYTIPSVDGSAATVFTLENRYYTLAQMISETETLLARNSNFEDAQKGISKFLTQINGDIEKKRRQAEGNLNKISTEKTVATAAAKTISDPFLVDRFFFELDEKYFSKFDITSFVANYGVTQTLEDGISWKISLQDEIISFNQLDVKNLESVRRPVLYPTAGSSAGFYREQSEKLDTSFLIKNIALYKSEEANSASTSEDDARRIEIGIRLRGIKDKIRKEKLTSILERTPSLFEQRAILRDLNYTVDGERLINPAQDGIRLSDLIQKNDLVTTFIYKHPLPPAAFEQALSATGISTSDNFYFDKEINLLRPQNVENKDLYLYDVEFNGFVFNIGAGENVGRVNVVDISGGGILSLMKSTRSIYASTIFQGSIFDAAEVMNQEILSAAQNIFVEKDPAQIAKLLLENLYRLKITGNGGSFDIDEIKKLGRFYDSNGKTVDSEGRAIGPRLLYTLPIYLLANVMRLREFYTTDGDARCGMQEQTRASGGLIYETNNFTSEFKSYFKYLSNSLADYFPVTKTPWEIIGDMRRSSYLEFFETLGGRIVYRTPQYNNAIPLGNKEIINNKEIIGTLITSRQLNIINTSYKDTLNNLVTKQPLGYAVDLIGLPIPQLHYFYTNGKLLAQYGLYMANAQQNPNVRFKPIKPQGSKNYDLAALQQFYSGIFKYCNFFLEYNNMALKTGTIQAAGDLDVEVGRTYFDTENLKFGYIIRVQKSLTVGGAYTMSFDLSAVRDATFAAGAWTFSQQPGLVGTVIPRPQFRHLPELIDVTREFGDTLASNISPSQTRAAIIRRETVRSLIQTSANVFSSQKKEKDKWFGFVSEKGYVTQEEARFLQNLFHIKHKKP